MKISQGEIFDIAGSLWLVVDYFHNNLDRYESLHCAPLIATPECRLHLDVSLTIEGSETEFVDAEKQHQLGLKIPPGIHGSYAALSFLMKQPKSVLRRPVTTPHPAIVERVRVNLVTYFSLYTMFDLTGGRKMPTTQETPSMHPGTILSYKGEKVCVVDHWGCFNEYPLLYVAPVDAELASPCPLDVDISSQYQSLFTKRNFVRTDDFFLVDREKLQTPSDHPPVVLRYGLLHKITRALVLKFGQTGLLL